MPLSALLEYRAHHLFDAALHLRVVGKGPHHGHLTGLSRRYPLLDKLAGIDEEPRAHPFAEAVLLEVAHLLAQLGELEGHRLRDATLVGDNARLELPRRIAELDGDEALAGAVLQILQGALIARIVGNDEGEAVPGLQDLAP